MRSPYRSIMATIAAGGLVLGLAACNGTPTADPEPTESSASDPYAELRENLPQTVLDSGVLKVASSLNTPLLYHYVEGTTETEGAWVEIIDEMAARLGLETEWQQSTLAAIPPLLQAGTVDLAGAYYVSTPENEGAFTVIGLNNNTTGYLAFEEYSEFTDLCGQQMGGTGGSNSELVDFPILVEACADADLPAPVFTGFPGFSDALVALGAGRLEGVMGGATSGVPANPPGLYQSLFEEWPFAVAGMAVAPDQREYADVLATVVNDMIADGFYLEVMTKWKLAGPLSLEDHTFINGVPFE